MANMTCDNCGKQFDEKDITQCPHCNHPIGTFIVTRKDDSLIVVERMAVLPDGGGYTLLQQSLPNSMLDKLDLGKEIILSFEYRINTANKYSATNTYLDSLK